MNKSVKDCLQRKRAAFKEGASSTDLHIANKELRREISKAKQKYKSEPENEMATRNLGSAWTSMKTIAGLQSSKSSQISMDGFNSETELANSLNGFYNRFDEMYDFSKEIRELRHELEDDQHLNIDLRDVEKAFLSVKVNKSHGPDDICGRLLKSCARELSPIFQFIFNKSLQLQHVPAIWKDTVVVPVPKVSCPKVLNDLRPVALSSVVMKAFEGLIKTEILKEIGQALDPMQLAYRPNRGVEDATVTLFNQIVKHVEQAGSHARLLFIDFSFAFNTMQPHILARRLLEQVGLSKNIVGWSLDFLTNRMQKVRVNGFLSDRVRSSTGSPQGCVLSPVFFILYTNMCQSGFDRRTIMKYADDTVIISLLQAGETGHGPVVNHFIEWCEESHLEINTIKTKDMMIDFRKQPPPHEVTYVKGQSRTCTILQVSGYDH